MTEGKTNPTSNAAPDAHKEPGIVSYVAAGAVGTAYAANSVENDFYKNLRGRGVFDKAIDVLKKDFEEVFKEWADRSKTYEGIRKANKK